MRGGQEHRDMCWGDVVLKRADTGRRICNTTNSKQKRVQVETRGISAPWHLNWLKHQTSLKDDPSYYMNDTVMLDPLISLPQIHLHCIYLAINYQNDCIRLFKRMALGQNTLYGLMKNMVKKGGITGDRKLTNHSVRKFMIQKLSDHQLAPTQIAQISGHKNLQSINNYSHLNTRQQEVVNDILLCSLRLRAVTVKLLQHPVLFPSARRLCLPNSWPCQL